MAGRNSIVLKGNFVRKEGKATAAVKPGMLVMWDTVYTSVKPQSALFGIAATRKAIALENDLVGQGITDQYDINDTVQYGVMHRGAEVQILIANSVNVVVGDPLVSNGDGTCKKATSTAGADDEEIVAYVMEALNNTSGSAAFVRAEVA